VPELLFVLDHDVAAGVGRALRKAGHRCVTAGGSGMALANDDAMSVFADNHRAVLLTHDREFSKRRRANTFGKHVLLDCREWDAAGLVCEYLDELVNLANSRDAICLKLSKDGVTPYPTRWE
jgi:hypothetical protein